MTFPYLFAPPIFSNLAANCQAHWARFGQYRASSCWYSPMFDYMSAPNPVNYMVPFGYNGGNNNDDDENNGNYWNNYWNNNWANNNGYGYNNRVGNRENSGSTKTGEGTTVEKANVETCKKLLDQIKSYPGISNAQKNIIADAVDQAKDKKSASEKLEIFKEALKKIGPDTIKDVLTSEPNGDFKNEYYDKLLAAGYEYSSTEVDEKIPELKRVLSKLSDSTGNATEADLQGLVDFDAYSKKNADHILDIISSWNTKYGKQDDESRRIITLVGNRYLETEDENIKSAIKDLMGTYITALTNKAEKVKGNLTGEAKGKLQAAIDRLRDADADSDTYSSESGIEELSNKFDALYLLLRQASISVITEDMKDEYSIINNLIDSDLFKNDTIDDLKHEGFSAEEIQNTEVKANRKPLVADEVTAEEQVNELIENDCLEETTVEYNGNKVYEETEKTGSRDYKRVFIIKDNDIVELQDAKIENGQVVKCKTEREIKEKVARADLIKKAVDKVREEREIEKGSEEEDEVINSEFDAGLKGKAVREMLRNWTTKDDTKDIDQILTKVNKNNVLDFLKGYYSKGDKNKKFVGRTEGLIEHLDDDNAGKNITMKNKKNLIKSALEKAKSLGLEGDDNYRKLKEVFEQYDDKNGTRSRKDRKDFNKGMGYFKGQDGKRWGSIVSWGGAGAVVGFICPGIGNILGTIVGGVAGVVAGLCDQVTDNEIMDKALEGLYLKMLEQEAAKKQEEAAKKTQETQHIYQTA